MNLEHQSNQGIPCLPQVLHDKPEPFDVESVCQLAQRYRHTGDLAISLS